MAYRTATTWMEPFDPPPPSATSRQAPTPPSATSRQDAVNTADSEPVDPRAEVLRLFTEHGTSLYRFCRSTLGSAGDAEDVVQDTFLKLLEHLEAGRGRSNLKAWIFTVAANACRTRLRWRVRWLPWQEERDSRTVESPEQPRDLQRARAAMRGLSARDRLLISLRAQGLSYRDIATAAGVGQVSVGRLLARAIDRWKIAAAQIEKSQTGPL